MKTVSEVLTAATDSVNLINSIIENNHLLKDRTEEELKKIVESNVKHLEIILAYQPIDDDDVTPDIVGSPDDKTSYINAINDGKTYCGVD